MSIRSHGRLLVVVGLPVLKRRDLGRGDPKLSLLRLWGQSSCTFNFGTIWSSSVLELRGSTHFYATKSSLKDALSLVSLAGDIRLNFLSPPRNVEKYSTSVSMTSSLVTPSYSSLKNDNTQTSLAREF